MTPQLASQVAAGSDLSALGTISDNDANTFSIGDVTVNELAGTMTFTVTRTGTSDVSIALDYASANGSALAGSDYTASTGTVTFAAGTGGTQTFTVPILGDLVVEGSESFTVNLTPQLASQVAAGSDLSALGTISDNDANTFSIGDVTVNESAGTMTFTVTRTGTSDVSIALDYASANGLALAGSDYTASTGTVTFAAGTGGTQTFTVPILDDSVVEGSESFTVNLTPQLASQVAAGSDLSALGTISDNDANTFSIGDVTVNESAGTMTFTVTRTGTSDVSIALDYASANGSALAGSDYTASTGTVTFAAGTGGTQTFTVPILDDSVVEGSESFTVNLTPQLASQVAAGSDLSAIGTISDNDVTGDPNDYDTGENPLLSSGYTVYLGDGSANTLPEQNTDLNRPTALYGRGGNDTVNGGNQVDWAYGGSGNDVITGSTQNDHLYGGVGNDNINGGTGSDIIVGGFGADTLTGGNSDDSFQFWTPNDAGDTITDYAVGVDKLEFVIAGNHTIDGTSFSGGFSLANQTTGDDASAITTPATAIGTGTVATVTSAGTSISGADIVIWNVTGSSTSNMNTATEIDDFLLHQNGTFDGGVLMAAYTEVAGVNQVAIYYDFDANSAGGTTLITTLSNITTTSSLSASDFHFLS